MTQMVYDSELCDNEFIREAQDTIGNLNNIDFFVAPIRITQPRASRNEKKKIDFRSYGYRGRSFMQLKSILIRSLTQQ